MKLVAHLYLEGIQDRLHDCFARDACFVGEDGIKVWEYVAGLHLVARSLTQHAGEYVQRQRPILSANDGVEPGESMARSGTIVSLMHGISVEVIRASIRVCQVIVVDRRVYVAGVASPYPPPAVAVPKAASWFAIMIALETGVGGQGFSALQPASLPWRPGIVVVDLLLAGNMDHNPPRKKKTLAGSAGEREREGIIVYERTSPIYPT